MLIPVCLLCTGRQRPSRCTTLAGFIVVCLCLSLRIAQAQAPEVQPSTHAELMTTIQNSTANVKVVNFWATWCVPCRQEFPALVQVGKDFAPHGVEVIFISADSEEDLPRVQAFLAEQNVTRKTYLVKGGENDFINAFHADWSGALPATFLFGRDGRLQVFWEGKTTYEELERRITEMIEEPFDP